MHRRTALVLAASVACGNAFARHRPADPRLFGKWRSDAERTLATWKFKPTATAETRAHIGKWFGKLTHTYTKDDVYTEFEGERFSSPYWVVEAGDNYVLIASRAQGEVGVESQRVFLEGTQYIFNVTRGGNVEYFKRVEA